MPIIPDQRIQALRGLAFFANEARPHSIGLDRGFEPNSNDIIDFQHDFMVLAERVDRYIEAYGEYLQSVGIISSKDVQDHFRHQLHNALAGNATYCIEVGIEERLEAGA